MSGPPAVHDPFRGMSRHLSVGMTRVVRMVRGAGLKHVRVFGRSLRWASSAWLRSAGGEDTPVVDAPVDPAVGALEADGDVVGAAAGLVSLADEALLRDQRRHRRAVRRQVRAE